MKPPGPPAASVGRILVVEDSPSARRLMQDVLVRLGAELPSLRVAGTVGLTCLHVFGFRDPRALAGIGRTFESLDLLRELGALFGRQLSNQGNDALNAGGRRRHLESMVPPRRNVESLRAFPSATVTGMGRPASTASTKASSSSR